VGKRGNSLSVRGYGRKISRANSLEHGSSVTRVKFPRGVGGKRVQPIEETQNGGLKKLEELNVKCRQERRTRSRRTHHEIQNPSKQQMIKDTRGRIKRVTSSKGH